MIGEKLTESSIEKSVSKHNDRSSPLQQRPKGDSGTGNSER
jgi:hypothetical protein